MPNWCEAIVKVKGKPKDVENFCKLFIFEDEGGTKSGKYFARSFIHETWKDFKKEYFGDITTEKECDIEFGVDFAWSCWSCMFEGYPTKTKKENPEGFGNCVTLGWAIKKYNVVVKIDTEEGGMGFEEHIITKNKKPVYSSSKMKEYKCYNCGEKQLIPSSYDLDEAECDNCGKIAWKDELKELIKEKIKKIKKK